MKNIICKVLCSLIFVSSFLIGCSNDNKTIKESIQEITTENNEKEIFKKSPVPISENEYLSVLEDLYTLLSSEIVTASTYGTQLLKVWENSSLKRTDRETDFFTKENGVFVDLNIAFQKFYADKTHHQELIDFQMMEGGAKRIVERIKASETPPQYQSLYEEALNTYLSGENLINLVTNYSNGYEETKDQLVERISKCKDNLKKFSEILKEAKIEPISKDEYLSVLEDFYEKLFLGKEFADENVSLFMNVWFDALFEVVEHEGTEEFVQPFGDFISVEKAITRLKKDVVFEWREKEIKKLITETDEIAERLKAQDPPIEYREVYKNALEAYTLCGALMRIPFTFDLGTYPLTYEGYKEVNEIWYEANSNLPKALEMFFYSLQEILSLDPNNSIYSSLLEKLDFFNSQYDSNDKLISYLKKILNLTSSDLTVDENGQFSYDGYSFSPEQNVDEDIFNGGLFFDRIALEFNQPDFESSYVGIHRFGAILGLSDFTSDLSKERLEVLKRVFHNDNLTQKNILDFLKTANSEYIEVDDKNLNDSDESNYRIVIRMGIGPNTLKLPIKATAFILAKLKAYGATYTFNPYSVIIEGKNYHK